MIKDTPKRILVAPLDWGLGHTTRCIPIIKWLLARHHTVLFAGNDQQCAFIENIFEGIETIYLDGYNIRYSRLGWMNQAFIFWQLLRLPAIVKKEHLWLVEKIGEINPDIILSDNRYGLYYPGVRSFLMTHQTGIQTGLGKWADRLLRQIHFQLMKPFETILVPDVMGAGSLGGALSAKEHREEQVRYIGWLSQFTNTVLETSGHPYILILLSGPEPQRSILQEQLWKQIQDSNQQFVFVTGSREAKIPDDNPQHVCFYGQLSGRELETIITGANLVICRSGYSSLMDLIKLGKKAILIPTPGQTEQEYLGLYLQNRGIFISMRQGRFNLQKALELAANFPFQLPMQGANFLEFEQVFEQELGL